MADVYTVANFFVDIASHRDDEVITNLKLNKLLYYAQGVYLARTGKKLFSDDIEAWDYGPVVPAIYQKYKDYKNCPISRVDVAYDPCSFAEDELDVLLDVMREYGKYTGSKLVALTHQSDTPWTTTYRAGKKVIDTTAIKEYFCENPVSQANFEKIPVVAKFPREWYDESEDAEWNALLQ